MKTPPTYKRFNPAYFKLVEKLEESLEVPGPPVSLAFLSRRQANAAKADIYRFRRFLESVDDSDKYAASLYATLNQFSICMETLDGEPHHGATRLVFTTNPLADALKRALP